MKLVLATGNKGKLKEMRHLLDQSGFEVLGLEDFEGLPEVVEDGDTFDANARKKAQTIADLTGYLTLADDSGLVVEALDGQPGVHSARYAGEPSDDGANNRKLLGALEGVPQEKRKAAFHCSMALCIPSGDCSFFSGRVEGVILEEARGEGGFGYDPLFLVREYGKTMAELPIEVKNRISHRGQALKKVVAHLLA